jgi:hypothetical protein
VAVTVYVASLSMPCAQTFGHIGASHLPAVLALPEGEREAALREAERDRLGVRELRKRVTGLRRRSGERRGRPGMPPEESAMVYIKAAVCEIGNALETLGSLASASPAMRGDLVGLSEELSQMSRRLVGAAVPGLGAGFSCERRVHAHGARWVSSRPERARAQRCYA